MYTPLIYLSFFFIQSPADPPFDVEWAKPLPALTQKFMQTSGWTGGDGATSIPFSDKRTLWVFGDSWIGRVENGRRVESRMINNAVAWQELGTDKPLRFFWNGGGRNPAAVLKPEKEGEWYWPGDGAVIDGKLYLFCKVVRRKQTGPPGFDFDWFANDLLKIDNPLDEPTIWKAERRRVSEGATEVRLGIACFVVGDYFHSLVLFPSKGLKPFDVPVGMARIHREKLARFNGTGWEYWSEGVAGPSWTESPERLSALFRDAAPEMSIGRVRGIPGLVAVYTAHGLGKDIMIRHASRPEGPWSKPLLVFHCPETDKTIFTYAGKFHPELPTKDGQLIMTYCRNIGDLAEHIRQPDVYVPQGAEVQLKLRK
jgi:hypothetical protein